MNEPDVEMYSISKSKSIHLGARPGPLRITGIHNLNQKTTFTTSFGGGCLGLNGGCIKVGPTSIEVFSNNCKDKQAYHGKKHQAELDDLICYETFIDSDSEEYSCQDEQNNFNHDLSKKDIDIFFQDVMPLRPKLERHIPLDIDQEELSQDELAQDDLEDNGISKKIYGFTKGVHKGVYFEEQDHDEITLR
jgi:hypothetical protein